MAPAHPAINEKALRTSNYIQNEKGDFGRPFLAAWMDT